jgi:hypothetical protein
MLNACILLVFLALIVNVPSMFAYLMGLKFQINDMNCSQEVKGVKTNILMTKIIQVFNTVITIALMILLNLM